MVDKKPEKKQECVQVVVRCRPFSTKEKNENRGGIIGMETALFQISIRNPSKADHPPKNFTFDAVYDETTQQKAFYEESCYDLVEGVMEGYNGTIFAYGQTGCGKTHTMQGYNNPPELRGVIPHSFDHIFENIKGSVNTAFLIRCCYLEIYNEEVRDLLAVSGAGEKRDKLELKEDPNKGVYVKGLTQAVVSSQEGINCLMDQGQKMRTVGATAMNETSSRSHSIFTIVVEINDVDEAGKDHIRVGKLNLVDLAGSERASKTGASGNRLKEGCKINLSLSALGNVISALVDGNGKHIPYRDSKLTRLLQDSLGGNTKTLMVAAISPADYNYEETLSTLRYANRAKNIKNKPKINEDPKDAMLRQYKEEIEALKQQLAASLGAADSSSSGGGGDQRMPPSPSSGGATAEAAPSAADPRAPSREPPPTSSSPSAAAAEARIEHNPQQHDIEEEGGNDGDGTAEPAAIAATTATAPTVAAGPEREDRTATGGVASELSVVAAAATGGGEGVERGQAGGEEEARDELESGETKVASISQVPPDVVVQEKIVERVVVEEKVVVQEVEVEVESQKMAEHRQALENYSRAVEEQRNRLGQELETSVIRADVEKQAREEMARKLDALQTKVIGLSSSSSQDRRRARRASVATRTTSSRGGGDEKGGSGNGADSFGSPTEAETEDPEVIIARRNAEHRRMQAKLRQKRRKETRLELERVRALEEKAEVEKEMADVVGQAEEKERRLNKSRKKLERKLVEAREEIEDLAMEHETEREELLDSIRNQNRELQLWEQVARQILSSKEIARIWERGEYNEDDQTWILPHIKPRGSYVGDPCKLPLLAPPGALHGDGGGGFDGDTNSPASGRMSSAKKDRRRGGGRSEAGDTRASISGGGQLEGSGSRGRIGSRASVSGKGGGGGERGGSGIRRASITGRGANEDRPPRRAGGEEAAPKEGGGGVFNEADRPWESFAGRESGAPRSKAGASPASAILWDSGDSPADDHYRGLTPPISPSPVQTQFEDYSDIQIVAFGTMFFLAHSPFP
ncbi:conserved unknown protein [Ectocarpus siliculosus]|uniref:Kinesin motor domain-containing protein n=1 Tax=Ectocarpus siliculosus TaxID=2880 RepID=D8LJ09_ECTSI|nr:conserved unknown protein [Ectocarpus siliculosus]|eukprot:CBN76893.1 conserved unknown protein [Ectocarpus siliculosus]